MVQKIFKRYEFLWMPVWRFRKRARGAIAGKYIHFEYEVGIHLTGFTVLENEIITDIFNKGLINNGHAMNGVGKNTFNFNIYWWFTYSNKSPKKRTIV